jgi:AcrR family transcriptional regulator
MPPQVSTALSRERIAAAAIDLIDEHGLAALSMRKLAERLGVGTMTVYGYFRDKDELLDAMVDAIAESEWGPAPEGPWQERLRWVARRLHEGLGRHPAIVELRLRRPIVTQGALQGTEIGMAALREAGLDPLQSASSFRVLFLYTFAFAAFSTPELGEAQQASARAVLAALPHDDFPTLQWAASALAATAGGEDEFERGLDRIVAGIEAMAARGG